MWPFNLTISWSEYYDTSVSSVAPALASEVMEHIAQNLPETL